MTVEKLIQVKSGWGMLAFNLAFGGVSIVSFVLGVTNLENRGTGNVALGVTLLVAGLLGCATATVFLVGHFTLQPNQARVLLLFGRYLGTTRQEGFLWANPFLTKTRLSLRLRNTETHNLKVNDKQGNPIEIAAVVVWRVENSAQAVFDVENYEAFVKIQSETAVRHLANSYAYDHGEEHEITLRSGVDEVSTALRAELVQRLVKAGIHVEEARLTHLAYAPEIAGAMLRRQQAEAVIAARKMIVHGAVSMVEMALSELREKDLVVLDEERKAAMVGNLLVILCGETEAQPVINTGTLYN
jgi:regulator of protease activity HflC (stomatin/prohibitin superfamily)